MKKLTNQVLIGGLDLMIFFISFNIEDIMYKFIVSGVCSVIFLIIFKTILAIINVQIKEYSDKSINFIHELNTCNKSEHNSIIEQIDSIKSEQLVLIKDLSDEVKNLNLNILSLVEAENNLIKKLELHNDGLDNILETKINQINEVVTTYQKESLAQVKDMKISMIKYNEDALFNINKVDLSLSNTIKTFSSNMIQQLYKLNGELYDNIDKSVQNIGEIVESSNNILNNSFISIKDEINRGNDANINNLKEIDNLIKTNLEEIGEMLDDILQNSISEFKEENNEYNYKLNRILEDSAKKLNKDRKNTKQDIEEVVESIKNENSNLLTSMKDIVQDIKILQGKTFDKMDDIQEKMLELNEDDINLMKEMIR